MFQFSFDNYMDKAYPADELKPVSCSGKNVFGPKGYPPQPHFRTPQYAYA